MDRGTSFVDTFGTPSNNLLGIFCSQSKTFVGKVWNLKKSFVRLFVIQSKTVTIPCKRYLESCCDGSLYLHNGNGRPGPFLDALWIQSKLVPRIYAFFLFFLFTTIRCSGEKYWSQFVPVHCRILRKILPQWQLVAFSLEEETEAQLSDLVNSREIMDK